MNKDFINRVLIDDSLKAMSQIESNSIDVTFADPPFNLKKKYNGYKDNKDFADYLEWCGSWLNEMVRITKPSGSIFVHNIPKWLTFYATILNQEAYFKHWISWDAPTAPMGASLQPSHYGILYYEKKPKQSKFYEIRHPHKRCRKCGYLLKDYGGKKSQLHPFGPLISDVWTDIHRIRHNKYRDEHPCQLPIHLLERIILMSSDEGDTILDPFVGTGTTVLAAKRLGRNYIGIDIDDQYASITSKKLENETSNSKLGNAWVSCFGKNIVTIRDKDWAEISKHYDIPDDVRQIDSKTIDQRNVEMLNPQFCFCDEPIELFVDELA